MTANASPQVPDLGGGARMPPRRAHRPNVINLRSERRTPPPPVLPRRMPRTGVAGDLIARPRAVAKRAIAERPRVVTPNRRVNTLLEIVQYPVIAGVALGGAYSSAFGQVLVLAFGLYALIRHRSSRLSFGLALFLLVTVPFFQAIGQTGIADNAAIYTYELLVIGTIQALLELRKTDTSSN